MSVRVSDFPPTSAPGASAEPAVTGTQSVFRALSILHAFSASQPALTGPEVAEKFGYSVPTAYRLLRALEAERFLVFDRVSHKYSPGPEILRLSGVILNRDGIMAQTQSSLERLRALSGETAALFWRLGNQRTCVQEMVSQQPAAVEAGLGVDYPLTRGAAGKALLFSMDDASVRDFLADPDVTPPAAGVDAFLADLRVSRERGYAVSAGETVEGALSIAAPLGWLHGLAAYSITGPQARLGPRRQEAVAQTLLDEMERLKSAMADGRRHGRRPRWQRLMHATR